MEQPIPLHVIPPTKDRIVGAETLSTSQPANSVTLSPASRNLPAVSPAASRTRLTVKLPPQENPGS